MSIILRLEVEHSDEGEPNISSVTIDNEDQIDTADLAYFLANYDDDAFAAMVHDTFAEVVDRPERESLTEEDRTPE